jgi:hypothetical protein
MTVSDGHLSAIDLDRALSEGASEEARAKVQRHVAVCARCRADHETTRQSYEIFRDDVLPRTAPALREQAAREQAARPRTRFFQRPWLWIPVAAAAALAVAIPTVFLHPGPVPIDERAQFGTKGGPTLTVVAKIDGQVVLLDRYQREAHPGDEVRFVLSSTPAGHPYLMIGAVDARAHASIYFPYEGARSVHVEQPSRWEVPGGITLDDTLGPERVFAIFSHQPLEVAVVRAALAELGAAGPNAIRDAETVQLPDTVQASYLLLKQPRGK